MEAIRLKKRIRSDSIQITGLGSLANRKVEVIILVEPELGGHRGVRARRAAKRKPGSAKGLIRIADDFHKPLDEDTVRSFYE